MTTPVRPWDLFIARGYHRDDTITDARLSVCGECSRYKAKVCTACGCFMPAKVLLSEAECPEGKWGRVDTLGMESS